MENGQITRRCKKCSETKPLTEFPIYDNKTDARRHECEVCQIARIRKWGRDNAARVRTQRKEKYWQDPSAYWTPKRRARANELSRILNARLREKILAVYGERCACCGESEKRFLTVDHVNNDGKDMRKVHGTGGSLYRWLVKHEFPAGFQTLCMNCNFGKALNKGICPHKAKEGSTTIP